jgi:adenosylcobinamide-GDP ribazoletransferase
MNGLRLAVSFLTILPVAPRTATPQMTAARGYFPLVGLLLGGAMVGIDQALEPLFPPALSGAVLLAALILLTRALHIDGFMDACDGLFGGFTRERRLEILRDSHVGAFAVIGVVALLLLKWTALVGLPLDIRVGALVLFPCLSRWGILMVMDRYRYARTQGMGTSFQQGRMRKQMALGFVTALVASLLLAGVAGILLLATATAVAWGLGHWMAGLLGGLTGDTYGAVNEVAEVAVLLLAVAIATAAPSIVGWPLPWRG